MQLFDSANSLHLPTPQVPPPDCEQGPVVAAENAERLGMAQVQSVARSGSCFPGRLTPSLLAAQLAHTDFANQAPQQSRSVEPVHLEWEVIRRKSCRCPRNRNSEPSQAVRTAGGT